MFIDGGVSALFFGLAAAASWGAGDFTGGVASKRSSVYTVIILSQIAGGLLLALLAWILREPLPALRDVLWGGAAGIAGAIGLAALYRGLAVGKMGVVAPVTAVFSAAFPVMVGMLLEGLPTQKQLFGLLLALAAVWFVSRAVDSGLTHVRDLGLPLLAGGGFGLFFVLMDRVATGSVLWPLVAARAASTVMMALFIFSRRSGSGTRWRRLPLITLAGVFDSGGNAFFTLAAQAGRLDIAAVLSSLYPAVTVLLAWLLLREPLSRQQGLGVGLALTAVVFITA